MGGLFGQGGANSSLKGATPLIQAPSIYENMNIPPFTSAGGISPDESALAQYGFGQNLLGSASEFGTSGTGMSTMATQAAGGARMGEAQTQGALSDVDQSAMEQAYYNQTSGELQNLGNQLSIANQQEQFLNELGAYGAETGDDLSSYAQLAGYTPGQGGYGSLGQPAGQGLGVTGEGTTNLGVY
jgi:hypothetical protein